MIVRVAIGDFSAMTHLSIKALRHYHDIGLLVPAVVDPATGYRFYDSSQVAVAQVIRRFRDLGMPLSEVKAVLQAPDVDARNDVIVAHLARMETQLSQTQATVASLRSLLERQPVSLPVLRRTVAATDALAVVERVAIAELDAWWDNAFAGLYRELREAGVRPAGPAGALYPVELFQQDVSEVVAFIPVPSPWPLSRAARRYVVPEAELAVAVHHGPFAELDRTYGSLGTYVAERELSVAGPIREYYVVSPADTADESQLRTEVGWPIFRTTPEAR
jgi:DNA-binding transcriptional MerR regulator